MKYKNNTILNIIKMFSLIVAMDEKNGIGYRNALPWSIPEDMKYFKELTTKTKDLNKVNVVIMGSKTHESVKDLPNRVNLVMSKTAGYTLDDILAYVQTHKKDIENVFVIGGAQIYKLFMDNNLVNKIYLNTIKGTYQCDTFFKPELDNYKLTSLLNTDKVIYKTYQYNNKDEYKYLDLLQNVLSNGDKKDDRTNIGTLSLVSPPELRFNLLNGTYPLLTTKLCSFRIIAKELLWMLSGSTDVKVLQKDNIHIWDGNSSKEFLKQRGLSYQEGDIGPGYGFLWRHYGADYKGCDAKYKGVDQIQNVINMINTDPNSRRILFCAWDCSKLDEMALPPCHLLYQFFVTQKKYLSCKLYMRSSDTFLGLPYNIASCALLTYIIAKVTKLEPKEIIISFGDAHIYLNHIDVVKKQLERCPKVFPKLQIKSVKNFDLYTFEDFELSNYEPHGLLKAPMAI